MIALFFRRRVAAALTETDGNSAVEFALAAPIMTTIMLACVSFGQVFQENIRLTNAANAGAQFSIVSSANAQNQSGIQSAVRTAAADLTNSINVTSATACSCEDGSVISCSGGTCASGDPIMQSTVTASENFTPSVATSFFTSAIALSATASMQTTE